MSPAPPRRANGSTLVVLARHGQTAYNVEARFRGRADPPLDARGTKQAEDLGRGIVPLAAAAVYTSPRIRARATANAIANATRLEVFASDALDDIDYGSWTGRTAAEVNAEQPADYEMWLSAPEALRVPGGERVVDVQSRVWSAVSELACQRAGQTVVVVTHDIAIRLVVCRVLDAPLRAIHAICVDTASTSALSFRDGFPKVAWLNAIDHLAKIPVSERKP